MIPTIYGSFDENQFTNYKEKLHKEIHWLLIYKDPKVDKDYSYVEIDKCFEGLLKQLDGLNEILSYPPQLVKLMSVLEAASLELKKESFKFYSYRKLILEAHHLVDVMLEEV